MILSTISLRRDDKEAEGYVDRMVVPDVSLSLGVVEIMKYSL